MLPVILDYVEARSDFPNWCPDILFQISQVQHTCLSFLQRSAKPNGQLDYMEINFQHLTAVGCCLPRAVSLAGNHWLH